MIINFLLLSLVAFSFSCTMEIDHVYSMKYYIQNETTFEIVVKWLFSLTLPSNNYRRVNAILINCVQIYFLYISEQILPSN